MLPRICRKAVKTRNCIRYFDVNGLRDLPPTKIVIVQTLTIWHSNPHWARNLKKVYFSNLFGIKNVINHPNFFPILSVVHFAIVQGGSVIAAKLLIEPAN